MTIRAVLFDLDGTLLANDMLADFVPRYFDQLAAYMAPWVAPELLRRGLWAGTEAMLANDGSRTNEQAFGQTFYPCIGAAEEALAPRIAAFYAEEFPKLRRHTQPRPEARRVVQAAFDLGYAVVIATNPLFPATATLQRMEWADVHGLPYRRVTTYENSCYAKPDLGYYREILDDLGCPAQEALVVGDEAMDMVAGDLGCLTYLVRNEATRDKAIAPHPIFEGTLTEVEDLLRRLRAD